jgi:hypothetical protein
MQNSIQQFAGLRFTAETPASMAGSLLVWSQPESIAAPFARCLLQRKATSFGWLRLLLPRLMDFVRAAAVGRRPRLGRQLGSDHLRSFPVHSV